MGLALFLDVLILNICSMLLIVDYITTHISNALKIKQIILDYIDIFHFYVVCVRLDDYERCVRRTLVHLI